MLRLTPRAKQLLEQAHFDALKALSFEQLIHGRPQDVLRAVCFPPTIPDLSTLPMDDEDMVQEVMEPVTLASPVVLSSGYVYSREYAEALLESQAPVCLHSGEALNRGVMVPLPKVTQAIAQYKFACQAGEVRANNVMMRLRVADNKLRLLFERQEDVHDAHLPFQAFFDQMFGEDRNDIAGIGGQYFATDWSFARLSSYYANTLEGIKLECWFPKGVFSDAEAIALVGKILSPLGLPVGLVVQEQNLPVFTMAEIPPHDYKEIFSLNMGFPAAVNCCMAFIEAMSEARAVKNELGAEFIDQVFASEGPAQPKTVSLGQFGMYPQQPARSASAGSSMLSTSSSLSSFYNPGSGSQWSGPGM